MREEHTGHGASLLPTNVLTYWYFLELLPPRWMHGDWFAFGEGAGAGAGPFRLFWKMHGQYFARELTAEETVLFCKLSRTSLHQ